jgi:hypothetical protein
VRLGIARRRRGLVQALNDGDAPVVGDGYGDADEMQATTEYSNL